MGFFGFIMLLYLIGAGGGMYFVLRKIFPDENPMWIIGQYFIYWILIELFLRYFMQKLPVMDIKPFLTTPVKKSSIAHYILGRSAASVYNLLSLFFFVPFDCSYDSRLSRFERTLMGSCNFCHSAVR